MSNWVLRINAYRIIELIYERFIDKRERKIRAMKEFTSKVCIIKNAKRFFANRPGQWGKTIEQRTQKKISNAMLHLYRFGTNEAQLQSKVKMMRFV